MERFWIQGAFTGGQVVLQQPLDLPDGTIVTVRDYDYDDDPRPKGPSNIMTEDEYAEFTVFFTRKKHPAGFPAFVERVERARVGRTRSARSDS